MSDEEIEAMAVQLEASARVEDARFRLEEFFAEDGDSISNHLIANRAGFLQLAALLLRSALREENVASVSLPEFNIEDHDLFFDKLQRCEDWVAPKPLPPEPVWRDRLSCLGCALFCFVISFVFLMGLAFIFEVIRP